MSRGWRVLDLTGFDGQISTLRGQINIKTKDGEKHQVSVTDIAVVLLGAKASISSGALHYLGRQDAAVLVCDWRGVPISGLYPWSDHTRVGARQIAQMAMSKPRAKNAWMRVIRAKISGQAANLRPSDPSGADYLDGLANQVKSGDPGNLEAAAARWYWSRVFGDPTFQRDYNGGDPANAMLNYGYGILRGFGVRAVTGAGLASTIGIFHHNRSNFFNLVEDLIEPFRPAIDWTVMNIDPRSTLGDSATKQALVDAATQTFSKSGLGIPAELDDLAQRFGRYAESETERLTVQAWKPPI